MHQNFSAQSAPSPASIEALGQNIALVFASAKETGQSEVVVREALTLFHSALNVSRSDMNVSIPLTVEPSGR